MAHAYMVVDLGYGDAGKGTTVDYLARKCAGDDPVVVVRFNGGPQAGHNVVEPSGRHHTFSTWGSGTFAGAPTLLAGTVLVSPALAFAEGEALYRAGVKDPFGMLAVDGSCRVILPWHVAENRMMEKMRGAGNHGSCGIGFGAAVGDSLQGEALHFGQLAASHEMLVRQLRRMRERKIEHLCSILGARAIAHGAPYTNLLYASIDELAGQLRLFYSLTSANLLPPNPGAVIFEGAQGVLIDENHGTPPFYTWSDCTFKNAERISKVWPCDEVTRLGVMRTYMVRHGPGPLPTEDVALNAMTPEPHNEMDEWQGHFRRGYLDFKELGRAIGACGGVDGLVLTHLDRRLPGRKVRMPDGSMRIELTTDIPGLVEEALGARVALTSSGPTWQDKEER